MKNKPIRRFLPVLALVLLLFAFRSGAAIVSPYVYPVAYSLDTQTAMDDHDDANQSFDISSTIYYSLGLNSLQTITSIQYFTDYDPRYEISYLEWLTPTWPLTENGTCYAEAWQGDWYDSGPCEATPGPLSFSYEYSATAYNHAGNYFGDDVTLFGHRTVSTSLNYFTGGDPAVSRDIFIRLQASAYDAIGGTNIPPATLTAGGQSCDAEGRAYRSGVDNAYYGGTVVAPGAYSNYTFSLSVDKAYLQLTWHGTNVLNQTNTVFVGEQIALTCQFVDASGQPTTLGTITNFQWTIPGNYISNYVVNSTSGTVYNYTNAAAYTNSGMTFYWIEGSSGSPMEVQCVVKIKGVTMTARTKFVVIKPTANLISDMPGTVAVGSGWLSFGLIINTNPGVRFTATNAAPSEIATNSCWFFLQTVSTDFRYSAGGNCFNYITNGLDHNVIYVTGVTNNNPFSLITRDSPGTDLETTTTKLSRYDAFVMYLMFQSTRASSVPIAIRQTSWFWGGVCTNVAGTWAPGSLLASTNYFGSINTGSSSLPTWNHNIDNRTWKSNASLCP